MTLLLGIDGKRIRVTGIVSLNSFRNLLDAMDAATRFDGGQKSELYLPSVELDFGECTSAAPDAMAAVVAHATKLRAGGVTVGFRPPSELRLRNLFSTAGWSNHLDPGKYEPGPSGQRSRVLLTQFTTLEEQGDLVNRVSETLLNSTDGMDRDDFGAVEWVINEIADNVLTHSASKVGGFIQVDCFPNTKRVEVIVSDPGVGIPRTLRGTNTEIGTDADALRLAIRAGVKGYASPGQGNGLHGAYLIAESSAEASPASARDADQALTRTLSGLVIHSGSASLEASRGNLSLHEERISYDGTLVIAGFDYSRPGLLARALRFDGRKLVTTDRIELKYEMDRHGAVDLDLFEEAGSFGSRQAGALVRTKILNLLRMGHGIDSIAIDLSRVPMVSSNFADEVFGRLYLEMGRADFARRIIITGASETVESVINHAISQRESNADLAEQALGVGKTQQPTEP